MQSSGAGNLVAEKGVHQHVPVHCEFTLAIRLFTEKKDRLTALFEQNIGKFEQFNLYLTHECLCLTQVKGTNIAG
jgi:hypothetical protein